MIALVAARAPARLCGNLGARAHMVSHVGLLVVAFAPWPGAAAFSAPPLPFRRALAPHTAGPACCAVPPSSPDDPKPATALPKREVDSRGFVVPQVCLCAAR